MPVPRGPDGGNSGKANTHIPSLHILYRQSILAQPGIATGECIQIARVSVVVGGEHRL